MHFHDNIKLLILHLRKALITDYPGVIYDNINPTPLIHRRLYYLWTPVYNVIMISNCLSPFLYNFLGNGICRIPKIIDHHLSSSFSK